VPTNLSVFENSIFAYSLMHTNLIVYKSLIRYIILKKSEIRLIWW